METFHLLKNVQTQLQFNIYTEYGSLIAAHIGEPPDIDIYSINIYMVEKYESRPKTFYTVSLDDQFIQQHLMRLAH